MLDGTSLGYYLLPESCKVFLMGSKVSFFLPFLYILGRRRQC